jgi:hypothetical protein
MLVGDGLSVPGTGTLAIIVRSPLSRFIAKTPTAGLPALETYTTVSGRSSAMAVLNPIKGFGTKAPASPKAKVARRVNRVAVIVSSRSSHI